MSSPQHQQQQQQQQHQQEPQLQMPQQYQQLQHLRQNQQIQQDRNPPPQSIQMQPLGPHPFSSPQQQQQQNFHYPSYVPNDNDHRTNIIQGSPSSTPVSTSKMKVVAGYGLQQRLGSGSFAVVYKGVKIVENNADNSTAVSNDGNTSDDDDSVVAIKAISRNSDKLTPKVLHNLEKEISILRNYKHTNIVCLKDVQKTTNHYYLILEYCSGGDLQQLIRTRQNSNRLSEILCRRLMYHLCQGIQFLHSYHLIHRDIKPQNLLLTGILPLDEIHDPYSTPELERMRIETDYPTDKFKLKIADFGFARHLQTTSLAETLCGSPLYMAPEILSHQRYDEKADLWSVGTVLFEMIAGKPPFNGDNHIHLLSNIQKNAVRLPPGVRVSKECVHLLRILLNRNPMQRASIPEFVIACNKFVALGINGPVPTFQDPPVQHYLTEPISESLMTVEETTMTFQSDPSNLTAAFAYQNQAVVTPSFGPTPSPPLTVSSSTLAPLPAAVSSSPRLISRLVTPLNAGSPHPLLARPQDSVAGHAYGRLENPTTATTFSNMNRMISSPQRIGAPAKVLSSQQSNGSLQNSSDDFVMVEHVHKTSDNDEKGIVSATSSDQNHYAGGNRFRLQQSPPTAGFMFRKGGNIIPNQTRDYLAPKQNQNYKGMLSTSPGTGGALMGMFMGRVRGGLLTGNNNSPAGDSSKTTSIQIEQRIAAATKMLAASEDVGRRAVCVAHLGDSRALRGIKLFMMMDASSSSSVFTTTMDGIEEEHENLIEVENTENSNNNRAIIVDSGCTEPMITSNRYGRQRSSLSTIEDMAANKNNNNADSDVLAEMPFALQSESPPVIVSAGIPSRPVQSQTTGYQSMTSSRNIIVKPTPAMIRSHFSEALLCYVKALNMLKGAYAAVEGVTRDVDSILSKASAQQQQQVSLLSTDQMEHLQQMKKGCEITRTWLGQQFSGVLERGDTANSEIRKFPISSAINSSVADDCNTPSIGRHNQSSHSNSAIVVPASAIPVVPSVEELIYTQSLALGREGAVKQLLGQNELARSCYRSAGLLAETLLMDSKNIVGEDRKTLENYVDAFATQIGELDAMIRQQQQQQQQLQQSQLNQQNFNNSNSRLLSFGHSNLASFPESVSGSYSPRQNQSLQVYSTMSPSTQRRISSGTMDTPLLPLAVDAPSMPPTSNRSMVD